MSPLTAWKEKFQVLEDCTLETALRNQLIDEGEYQEWASKYYGLPVVEDEFFSRHLASSTFINNIKNIASPSAVPCFEWNRILYIACLEPQKINAKQKTVFFIASLRSMESLWDPIQSLKEDKKTNDGGSETSPSKYSEYKNSPSKHSRSNTSIENRQ